MKNSSNILLTGSNGNVGSYVKYFLDKKNISFLTSSHRKTTIDNNEVYLNFEDLSSFEDALEGIKLLFLVRPPALSNVDEIFVPFLEQCKLSGVEHIVFLSLLGAENNSITPHRKIEKKILEMNFSHTFIRPSFFMQNLTTTHLEEIRNGEIFVPAGTGKTNFIDTKDIGEFIAEVVSKPNEFKNNAYELTGPNSYDYYEIASLLSEITGKKIEYKRPGILRFSFRKLREGQKLGFVIVMTALYSITRFGRADSHSDTFENIMKKKPRDLKSFLVEKRTMFM